jgi:hypothetical protein
MTDRPRHPMTPVRRNSGESLRIKASEIFQEKTKRSEAVFEQMQTERAISDAKTAKLRTLRLAKEAAAREQATGPDGIKCSKF